MAVAVASAPRSTSADLARELAPSRGRRWVVNIAMTVLMALCVGIVGFALVLVLITLLGKGLSIVTANFPDWFTTDVPLSARREGPGMKSAIIGTLVITATATAIAVPLGILGAVYLNEFGKRSAFARALRFLTNVMAGVPSIVMGLFIYVFWVTARGVDGLNAFSGALALACLMLPIVVRSSEEMLRLVPQNLRDASNALGATPTRTTLSVTLPSAAPGIVSGCLLAIARAAGETAPLVFTIGAAKSTNWNPFSGANTALPMQIYGNAKESFDPAQARAWGAALTLILIAFAAMIVARIVTAKLSKNR